MDLFSLFRHDFIVKAFIVGIIVAISTSLIGTTIVLKRLSMVGDTLSHAALAGVTAGLAFGFNPVLGSVIFSIVIAFGVEVFRKKFSKFSEISIAIMLSTSVGLAGLFSSFIRQASNLNSFLFGSLVAIDAFEFRLIIIIGILVIFTVSFFYKELFFITFDEDNARLNGINTKLINFCFTTVTALTIAIASRVVGALIVSSMIVIPVATALQLKQSYFRTLLYSALFGVFYTIIGLYSSYFYDLKPGSTIVLISVIGLIFTIVLISFKNLLFKNR